MNAQKPVPSERPRGRLRWPICDAVGVAVVVTVSWLGAVASDAPGGWVVWMVVQFPFGFVIGVLAWLCWRIVYRVMRRDDPRNAAVGAALCGTGLQLILWVLYWLDSNWYDAPLIHVVALAGSTLGTFFALMTPRPDRPRRPASAKS